MLNKKDVNKKSRWTKTNFSLFTYRGRLKSVRNDPSCSENERSVRERKVRCKTVCNDEKKSSLLKNEEAPRERETKLEGRCVIRKFVSPACIRAARPRPRK